MSVPAVESIIRSALCPKTEYNSAPGVQVSKLILKPQLSCDLTPMEVKVQHKKMIAVCLNHFMVCFYRL